MSPEEHPRQILERELTERPLSARIRELWGAMPDEVRVKLPSDGSSQVDHYVYGVPKREP